MSSKKGYELTFFFSGYPGGVDKMFSYGDGE